MHLIRATGPVAAALRRYDPNLDVRYSWERRSWAISFRTRRPDLIPRPVRPEITGSGIIEHLMPERSEAYISYRTKTYPAAYVKKLSWNTFERIVASDVGRNGSVTNQVKEIQAARDAEIHRQNKDRWKEARSFMNWHGRNNIMAD
jgi:hypothetical protein